MAKAAINNKGNLVLLGRGKPPKDVKTVAINGYVRDLLLQGEKLERKDAQRKRPGVQAKTKTKAPKKAAKKAKRKAKPAAAPTPTLDIQESAAANNDGQTFCETPADAPAVTAEDVAPIVEDLSAE